MKCPHCQNEISDSGSKYCPYCGKKLSPMGQKIRIMIDDRRGSILDKLVEIMSERCQTTFLGKKPLDLQLAETDVFMIADSNKKWKDEEVEAVGRYVENQGGILVIITYASVLAKMYLSSLLALFGFTQTDEDIRDKQLDREKLADSPLLGGVESLACGTYFGMGSSGITISGQAEVLLKYNEVILGAKCSLGKGIAYLFSCLPIFSNKQLNEIGNKRFIGNLLTSLGTPTMEEALAAAIKDETLDVQEDATSPKQYGVYFREPLSRVAGESVARRKWDEGEGLIVMGKDGLTLVGNPRLSKMQERISSSFDPLTSSLTRGFFQSRQDLRKVDVALKEITKVVLPPLESSPSSGIVYIFTKTPDGTEEIHCFSFDSPKNLQTSWPPFLLFRAWLNKNIPADKLKTLA